MAALLSQTELQRYDRQIRVWGAEAQSRIQKSKILVCGLNKLNVEAVKNIVLAGMHVTVQDSSIVTVDDLSSNFFVTSDHIGHKVCYFCKRNDYLSIWLLILLLYYV